jgi:hypothetical protein
MAALHVGVAEIRVQAGDGIVDPAGRIMSLPTRQRLVRRRREGLGGLDGKGACGHGVFRHESVEAMLPHAERPAG